MAQPPEYLRQFNFTDYQEENPDRPLPGDEHDVELNTVKVTLDAILHNLGLIQRDDGQLANESVGREQLQDNIMLGFNAPEPWITNHAYTTLDTVFESGKFYLAEVAHTSGIFANDLAAGYWKLLADMTGFGVTMTDLEASETGVASANICLIGQSATFRCLISGTTDIHSFDAMPAAPAAPNLVRFLRFSGALKIHHDAGSLILPGGYDISVLPGDQAIFVSDGVGNWRLLHFQKADGSPPGGFTSVQDEVGAMYPAFPVGTTERYGVFANGFTQTATRNGTVTLTSTKPGAFLRIKDTLAAGLVCHVWGNGIAGSSVSGALVTAVDAAGNTLTMSVAADPGTATVNVAIGTDYASDYPDRMEAIRINAVNPDIEIIWPPGNLATSLNMFSDWSGTVANPARHHFRGTDFFGLVHFLDGVSNVTFSGVLGCYDRFGIAQSLAAGAAAPLNPPSQPTPQINFVSGSNVITGVVGQFNNWPVGATVLGGRVPGASDATSDSLRRGRGRIVEKAANGSSISLDTVALVTRSDILITGQSTNIEVGTVICKDEIGANYAYPGVGGRGFHIVGVCDFRFDRLIVENCDQSLGTALHYPFGAVQFEQVGNGIGVSGNEIWVQNSRTHAVYCNGLGWNVKKIRVDGYAANSIHMPATGIPAIPFYSIPDSDGKEQSETGTGVWFNRMSGYVGTIEVRQRNESAVGFRALFIDQTGRPDVARNQNEDLKIDTVYIQAGSPVTGFGGSVLFGEPFPEIPGAFTPNQRVTIDEMTVVLPENWTLPAPSEPLIRMNPVQAEGYIKIGVLNMANPQSYQCVRISGSGVDKRSIDIGALNVYDFVDAGSVVEAGGSSAGDLRLHFGDINIRYLGGTSTAQALLSFSFCQQLSIDHALIFSSSPVGSQAMRVVDCESVTLNGFRVRNFRADAGTLSFANNSKLHFADLDMVASVPFVGRAGVGIRFDAGSHGDYSFEGVNTALFSVGLQADAGAVFHDKLALNNSRSQGDTLASNLSSSQVSGFNQNYVVSTQTLDVPRTVPDSRFSSFLPSLRVFSCPAPLAAVTNWDAEAYFEQLFASFSFSPPRDRRYTVVRGDLWVGPTGDDSFPGLSINAPKKTVSSALQLAGTGSGTIWVLPGSYHQRIDHTKTLNLAGSIGRPTKIKAYAGLGSVYFYATDKQPWQLTWTKGDAAPDTYQPDVYLTTPTNQAGGPPDSNGNLEMVLARSIDPITGLYTYQPLIWNESISLLNSGAYERHSWAQDQTTKRVAVRYKGLDLTLTAAGSPREQLVFVYDHRSGSGAVPSTLKSTNLYFQDLIFVGTSGISAVPERLDEDGPANLPGPLRSRVFFTNCHSYYSSGYGGGGSAFYCIGSDLFLTDCKSLYSVSVDGVSYNEYGTAGNISYPASPAKVTVPGGHTIGNGRKIKFTSNTLPAPLVKDVIYYARNVNAPVGTFELGTTPGAPTSIATTTGPVVPELYDVFLEDYNARGLEIGCECSHNGQPYSAKITGDEDFQLPSLGATKTVTQGSSMHGPGTIVRINSRYEGNLGQNIGDANAAGSTSWGWMVGCWLGNPWVFWSAGGPPSVPGDTYPVGTGVLSENYALTGHAWLDTIYSGGVLASYGLELTLVSDPNPVVKTHNCTFFGATAPISGTVIPYTPATP